MIITTWQRINISKKLSSGRAELSWAETSAFEDNRRRMSALALFKPGNLGKEARCSSMRRLCMPAIKSNKSSFKREGLSAIPNDITIKYYYKVQPTLNKR